MKEKIKKWGYAVVDLKGVTTIEKGETHVAVHTDKVASVKTSATRVNIAVDGGNIYLYRDRIGIVI